MAEPGITPCVKTLRGIIAPGILGSTVMRRAKKRKNLSSARHYDQIRFRFHTAKTQLRHRLRIGEATDCSGQGCAVTQLCLGYQQQHVDARNQTSTRRGHRGAKVHARWRRPADQGRCSRLGRNRGSLRANSWAAIWRRAQRPSTSASTGW